MSEFAAAPAPASVPKYIFENGVMKMNPAYAAATPAAGAPAVPAAPPRANQPVAVVTCMADVQQFSGIGSAECQVSASTTAAIEEMNSPAYQVGSEMSMTMFR